jgi:hypothetical protein
MDVALLVLVLAAGIGALALIVAGLVRFGRQRRQRRVRADALRDRFGPEYDRAVGSNGRWEGERALESRLAEYGDLEHPSLSPRVREEHTETWRRLQLAFIDSPERSVREAEHLVVTVMEERGFPTDDGGVRADALSVEDPDLADSYRAAHRAFCLAERGAASSDQLLGAILVYRELFERLLDRPRRERSTFDDIVPVDDTVTTSSTGSGAER